MMNRPALTKLAHTLGTAATALLYPRQCALCRHPLPVEEAPGAADALCAACAEYLLPLDPPFCAQCAEPLAGASDGSEVLCEACSDPAAPRWHLSGAVCALRASRAAWELVHAFKYGREAHLAPLLGRHFTRVLADPRFRSRRFDAIIPVPLHRVREQERGFNQAELLADLLAHEAGVPLVNALKRVRPTGTQTHLSRAGRQKNLRGAFQLRRRVPVEGRNFLLIDDVLTTGSTLDECARLLKAAGAGEVWAATLVRAGGAD